MSGKIGLGKFEGGAEALKQLMYAISLDGGCEEYGDCERTRYYCKIDGPFNEKELKESYRSEWGDLDAEDKEDLKKIVGVILNEGNDGFVECNWFEDKKEFEKAWKSVQDWVDEQEEGEETDVRN